MWLGRKRNRVIVADRRCDLLSVMRFNSVVVQKRNAAGFREDQFVDLLGATLGLFFFHFWESRAFFREPHGGQDPRIYDAEFFACRP